MDITVKYALDKKTLAAFSRASMFNKGDPKKKLIQFTVLLAIALALDIILMCISPEKRMLALLNFLLGLFLLFILFYRYFAVPAIQYKGRKKFGDVSMTVTFTDDALKVHSCMDGASSDETVSYGKLVKVSETHDYIFVYITDRSAYVIDKSAISENDLVALHKKLALSFGDKYYVLNY
ncbi:MAG: YcxB family protein [Eubacteriales bacterium]